MDKVYWKLIVNRLIPINTFYLGKSNEISMWLIRDAYSILFVKEVKLAKKYV